MPVQFRLNQRREATAPGRGSFVTAAPAAGATADFACRRLASRVSGRGGARQPVWSAGRRDRSKAGDPLPIAV